MNSLEDFVALYILDYKIAPLKSPCQFVSGDGGFYGHPDLSELDTWFDQILPALSKKGVDFKIEIKGGKYLIISSFLKEQLIVSSEELKKALLSIIIRYKNSLVE